DGCGRTGAYICLDSNLDLAEEDSVYDVFGYTKSLRNARRGMVEDVNQYRFIYEALEESLISGQTWFPVSQILEESLISGQTWFPVSQISQRLKHKSQKNPITRQNEYQREYEVTYPPAFSSYVSQPFSMKWPSGVPWCMATTWSTTYVVEKCDAMWKLPHPVLTGGS
ncbi:hypothetical protein AVEN_229334-1, partial [Araneus ventricosus]